MKLQANTPVGLMTITSYDEHHIAVAGHRLETSFILTPRRLVENWTPRSIEQLDAEAMTTLADIGCSIVLLGTGARQHFPSPELMQPLLAKRIGLEVMDNFAACRTYNILIAEDRDVSLAILMGPSA
jgi:uncharacterized protein